MSKSALIMIDIQNDFCENGSLAVPNGDAIVPVANKLQNLFEIVIATQDWHPKAHKSFASSHPGAEVGEIVTLNQLEQILWPDHCVQNSKGAEFHPQLNVSRIDSVFKKGTDPEIDSYSAFFDNAHLKATGLHDYLQNKNVSKLYLMGLATDYCVKFSALDAVELGYDVTLITDGCRGVNLNPDDVKKALSEMTDAGVKLTTSTEMLQAK